MSYEPDGLRVKLEDSTGTKKFIWDNQTYLAESDENNDIQVVFTQIPTAYGNLISQRRSSATLWYHYQALGSTTQISDSSESVTDSYLYDAWGNVVDSIGNSINPFQFIGNIGYHLDIDSQNIYVRARNYSTTIGRWSNPDPAGFVEGPNLYTAYFIPNDVDPSGKVGAGHVVFWVLKIGVLVAGAAKTLEWAIPRDPTFTELLGTTNRGPVNQTSFSADPTGDGPIRMLDCPRKSAEVVLIRVGAYSSRIPHPFRNHRVLQVNLKYHYEQCKIVGFLNTANSSGVAGDIGIAVTGITLEASKKQSLYECHEFIPCVDGQVTGRMVINNIWPFTDVDEDFSASFTACADNVAGRGVNNF